MCCSTSDYGFRARRVAAIRNDELCYRPLRFCLLQGISAGRSLTQSPQEVTAKSALPGAWPSSSSRQCADILLSRSCPKVLGQQAWEAFLQAKKPLTDRAIRALPPTPRGKRKLVWDALVPGLAVRVVRLQMLWESLSCLGTEALARLSLSLGGFQLMLQSSQFDGVAFDPFSFQKDGLASAEVDVGRR